MNQAEMAADVAAIGNLVAESQYLIDTGAAGRLADEVFAAAIDGVVPEADFGFDVWRGTDSIRVGFARSLARFEACVHAVTNLHVTVEGDTAVARYYVQGWHWVRRDQPRESTHADFLVLGLMTDTLVRQHGEWRVARRHLARMGPGVALGVLPEFLTGLGES